MTSSAFFKVSPLLALTLMASCTQTVRPDTTAATPAALASNAAKSTPAPPTHQAVLYELQNTPDALMPPRLGVHPVHLIYNREAIIPPMCYTKTEGQHNPCYVCHQEKVPGRPNTMDDGDLQRAYSFSAVGQRNHWQNLFEDRQARVEAISDQDIRSWVEQDNYSHLAQRLKSAGFRGYIPDLSDLQLGAKAFDEEGFARDGSHWVAFNYKPLPSTFWPTNGSMDDVMIRLPEPYRTTAAGSYSRDVYKANLAILEARIKGLDEVSVHAVSERAVGADLNGDGQLTTIGRIRRVDGYVGAAAAHYSRPLTYPLDTEFLHSVRYIGVDKMGQLHMPQRMKELRYMRKRSMLTGPALYEAYLQEHYAKDAGELPGYVDRGAYGLDNEMGWVLTGFLENKQGHLRVNTYEENLYCMGCHTSVGSTIDQVFSFARKVDGAAGFRYIELRGMPDAPNYGESEGEIATYFRRAGGGGEFRSNPEILARFFTEGHVDADKLATTRDVYDLIMPSAVRALALNKAYRTIVEDQDFIYGRDATVTAPVNVHQRVDNLQTAPLSKEKTYRWDMRLQWGKAPASHLD